MKRPNEYTRIISEAPLDQLIGEFNQILQKKSALPRSARDLVTLRVKSLMDSGQIKVETEKPLD